MCYQDDKPRDNGRWDAYGCAGEVRSARGFLMLWRDGAERLAETVRSGPVGMSFPGAQPLFAAAGIVLPVHYAPDATRREVDALRPVRLPDLEEVLPGRRNVALCDVTSG